MTIFFTIHEGIETLAQFSSNESYSAFLALVTNDDNIIIVDTQDAMCKKYNYPQKNKNPSSTIL